MIQAKARAEATGVPDQQVAIEIFPGASTPESASTMMSRELKKVENVANLRDLLADALEEFGLSPRSVVKIVAQASKATRTTGEIRRFYDEEGNLVRTQYKRSADHSTRLKAVQLAAKFMGVGDSDQAPGGGIHFHNHIEEKKDAYGFSK